jgi:hypothetical protein
MLKPHERTSTIRKRSNRKENNHSCWGVLLQQIKTAAGLETMQKPSRNAWHTPGAEGQGMEAVRATREDNPTSETLTLLTYDVTPR